MKKTALLTLGALMMSSAAVMAAPINQMAANETAIGVGTNESYIEHKVTNKMTVGYQYADRAKMRLDYEDFQRAPKDEMGDGEASELDSVVRFEMETGNREKALKAAEEIFRRRLRTEEVPCKTYYILLSDALASGDTEKAAEYAEPLRRLCDGQRFQLEPIGMMLCYDALTDPERGLRFWKKNLPLREGSRNPFLCFWFDRGAASGGVGQMPLISQYTLFQRIRIGSHLKHIDVVIGLEKDYREVLEISYRIVIILAQVRDDPDLLPSVGADIGHRICRVVGDVNRVNRQVPYREIHIPLHHVKEAVVDFPQGRVPPDGPDGAGGPVDGKAVAAGHDPEAGHVVRVLMGDEDAREFFGF